MHAACPASCPRAARSSNTVPPTPPTHVLLEQVVQARLLFAAAVVVAACFWGDLELSLHAFWELLKRKRSVLGLSFRRHRRRRRFRRRPCRCRRIVAVADHCDGAVLI